MSNIIVHENVISRYSNRTLILYNIFSRRKYKFLSNINLIDIRLVVQQDRNKNWIFYLFGSKDTC